MEKNANETQAINAQHEQPSPNLERAEYTKPTLETHTQYRLLVGGGGSI
jgi:hypothetical protein